MSERTDYLKLLMDAISLYIKEYKKQIFPMKMGDAFCLHKDMGILGKQDRKIAVAIWYGTKDEVGRGIDEWLRKKKRKSD